MPDKSTPNPSDPDPEKKPQEPARPRLKLQRLVVKDVKINPHVDPDSEPVPKAEAYSEPDPPPVDPPKPEVPEPPRVPEEKEEPPPPVPEPPKEEEAQPKAKLSLEKPKPEEAEPPPEESKTAPKKAKKPAAKKKKRRKSSIIFPLILIVGSLLYGTHLIFDPLGLKTEPIVPQEVPIRAAQAGNSEAESLEVVSTPDVPTLQTEGSLNAIQAYVERLSRLPVEISSNPDGVFIDAVHYSEGMAVNPSLGLVIDSISSEPGNQHVQLRDAEGQTYSIPVN